MLIKQIDWKVNFKSVFICWREKIGSILHLGEQFTLLAGDPWGLFLCVAWEDWSVWEKEPQQTTWLLFVDIETLVCPAGVAEDGTILGPTIT